MKKRAIKRRNKVNKQRGRKQCEDKKMKDQEKESIDNRGSRIRKKIQKNMIESEDKVHRARIIKKGSEDKQKEK